MLKYILADLQDNYWHIMYTNPNILSNLHCLLGYTPICPTCEPYMGGYDTTSQLRCYVWKPYNSVSCGKYLTVKDPKLNANILETLDNTNTYIQGGRISVDNTDELGLNTALSQLSQDGNWFVDYDSCLKYSSIKDNAIIINSDIAGVDAADNSIIVDSCINNLNYDARFNISGYTVLKNIKIIDSNSVIKQLYNVLLINEFGEYPDGYKLMIETAHGHPGISISGLTIRLNDKTLEYFKKYDQEQYHDGDILQVDGKEEPGLVILYENVRSTSVNQLGSRTFVFIPRIKYAVSLSQFIKDFS